MSRIDRWPKGPFPEKYRWDAVERRLREAWADPRRSEVLALVTARGFAPHPEDDDRYYKLFERAGPIELDAVRAALSEAGVFAFEWSPRTPRDVPAIGLVASPDPVDAIVAVGVAGPRQGVGTPTVVRFVVTLRSFAAVSIDVIGEDRVSMGCVAQSDDAALRIAERVVRISPSLGRDDASTRAVAAKILATGRLELDWS